MSQFTPHRYNGFNVNFDELEPENTITMRKAVYEALAGVTLDVPVDRLSISIGEPNEAVRVLNVEDLNSDLPEPEEPEEGEHHEG